MKKEFDVLGFGEVMLRLSPMGKERISQSESFEKKAGGAELNVVSGIAQLGMRTGIITKLPSNEIGKFIKNKIRYCGISDDYLSYDESMQKRLGIYYYESGAYPRVPTVVYDRYGSSFAHYKIEDLDEKAYGDTKLFHVSGITLALCENTRSVAVEMVKRFKENGSIISFDVNYRASLWDEDTAREVIERILPYIDLLFVSEETLRRTFRQEGQLRDIMKRFAALHDNVKVIASTQRKAKTATRHNWSSLAYDAVKKTYYTEKEYEDIEVVDRIGSGDAYVAGALYGYLKDGTIESMVEYGDAMASVKNTIEGDMTACDIHDIERVIHTHKKGATSEMVR